MNFNPIIKYIVIHSKSGKYISEIGMTDIKEDATEFNVVGLRKRFKATKKATKNLEDKINASDFHLERVTPEDSNFFTLKSNISHSKLDILLCDATYHYSKDTVKMRTIYCENSGIVRKPKDHKGTLEKIEFEVVRIVGEATPN